MKTKTEKALKAISEMDSLLKLLFAEVNNSNEFIGQNLLLAEKTNDLSLINSLIRMRIRIVVSFFESACYKFRHVAREICELWKKPIPERYSDLFDKNKKFEIKDKIKLSLRFLAYATTGVDTIDTGSGDWKRVCDLIEKRHHLTHPNSIFDLEVSENDLNSANVSIFWFVKQLSLITKKKDIQLTIEPNDDYIKDTIKQFREKYKGII